MPDEHVVSLSRDGDADAVEHLLQKYKPIVLYKSRSYFLHGADRDDMIQEGMIGLFKAIRDFRADRDCSFRTFAGVCITRQMITAVKSGGGQRQLPLTYATSLDAGRRDKGDEARGDFVADTEVVDPEQVIIARESKRELRALLRDNLSQFEWCVFVSYTEGKSYQKIAEEQGSTPKSVDNALCRVRCKVQKFRDDNPDRCYN